MFRQLATLLKAGTPLDVSLEAVMRAAGSHRMAHVASTLLDGVRSGATLADAMETAGTFKHFAVGMVRAGESVGALDIVVHRLAEFNERAAEIRLTVASAVFYPLVLAAVLFIALVVSVAIRLG